MARKCSKKNLFIIIVITKRHCLYYLEPNKAKSVKHLKNSIKNNRNYFYQIILFIWYLVVYIELKKYFISNLIQRIWEDLNLFQVNCYHCYYFHSDY